MHCCTVHSARPEIVCRPLWCDPVMTHTALKGLICAEFGSINTHQQLMRWESTWVLGGDIISHHQYPLYPTPANERALHQYLPVPSSSSCTPMVLLGGMSSYMPKKLSPLPDSRPHAEGTRTDCGEPAPHNAPNPPAAHAAIELPEPLRAAAWARDQAVSLRPTHPPRLPSSSLHLARSVR